MLVRLRSQPALLCTCIFLLTTEWKRVQTNIWQDPYVKSEAVLFLYELDSDAHTAAMDMFEAQDAYAQAPYGLQRLCAQAPCGQQ
jgi:hypothetical protein